MKAEVQETGEKPKQMNGASPSEIQCLSDYVISVGY